VPVGGNGADLQLKCGLREILSGKQESGRDEKIPSIHKKSLAYFPATSFPVNLAFSSDRTPDLLPELIAYFSRISLDLTYICPTNPVELNSLRKRQRRPAGFAQRAQC
jgi:hypothetical protein